ncbi:rhomboid family intramembrane serine protease [Nonomuraea spiralis]|uniref:Rhomboid family intramembrane serine protease n=1 Tax=Nonomuraea spiralis TaxID=46182 RepID=A0ABV5I870_9ACTN|nr:rhomboid family intramembrane serine protease [Nonomuraea spiralis]
MFKPYVTAVVFVVTAVPSLLQFALPGLEPAWMRDPAAISGGEWWRLGTALVVQDGGVFGVLFNLAFLAVLGYAAERAFGPGRWLLLYASGAIAGEAAGYLLNDPGAGNSIALCGLAGALAVAAPGTLERSLGAFYAVVSGAWALSAFGTVGVVLMVALAAGGFQLVVHRDRVPGPLFPAVAAVAAVVLCVLPDLHGFALLAGVLAGWAGAYARTTPARTA